jgi:tRNA splicing ligase
MYHQKLLLLKPKRPEVSKAQVISQAKKQARETEGFAQHTKTDPFETKRLKEAREASKRFQMFSHH